MSGAYTIFVQSTFSAAHSLRGYPGDCAQVHGHNWTVEVHLLCRELDDVGLGIDFRTVKDAVRNVLKELDHTDLNEHEAFQAVNPSSEQLARYLYGALRDRLSSERIRIAGVKVMEAPGQGVLYTE